MGNSKDTISIYQQQIRFDFSERGENFTVNVPHKKKWNAMIKFLRKRGFKVGVNQYYKERYSCLSKYNKIGHKGSVVCLLNISSSSIKLQFGHIKNLWENMPQDFWNDPTDSRHTKLTYLEQKSIELEIKKIIYFTSKYEFEFEKRDSELSPEQFIISNNKSNPHIHGNINSLDDIGKYIKPNTYDYNHNSFDSNKKRIICGELKYFYDYRTGVFSCGTVYHNINNMWWVVRNDVLSNIASFNLFDFDKTLIGRRKLTLDQKKKKILSLISKNEKLKDYQKCSRLQTYLFSLEKTL